MRRPLVGMVLVLAVGLGVVRRWHMRRSHPPRITATSTPTGPAVSPLRRAAQDLQGCLLGPGLAPTTALGAAARLRRVALAPGRSDGWPGSCLPRVEALIAVAQRPEASTVRPAAEALRGTLRTVSLADVAAYREGARVWDPTALARAWIDLGRGLVDYAPSPRWVAPAEGASPMVAAPSQDLLPIALEAEGRMAGGTYGGGVLSVGWELPGGVPLACLSRDRGASWACRRGPGADGGVASDAGVTTDAGVSVAAPLRADAVGEPEDGRVRVRVGGRWVTVARVATGGLRARTEASGAADGGAVQSGWHGVVDDGPGGLRAVQTLWAVAAEGRLTLFVVGEAVTVWWSDDQGDSWRPAAEAYEPPARISLDVGRVRPSRRR